MDTHYDYDIGLVSNYAVTNYGGALTNYALYSFLRGKNYSVLMIDCRIPTRDNSIENFENWNKISQKIFKIDPYEKDSIIGRSKNKSQLRSLCDLCNVFMVGSDQLFNNYLFNLYGQTISLDWVRSDKPKIAYAVSFGHDYIWGSQQDRAAMSHFMKEFDAFSVREKSGIQLSKKEFGVESICLLDPVFICDYSVYDKLAEKATKNQIESSIFSYALDGTPVTKKTLNYCAEKLNLPINIIIDGYKSPDEETWEHEKQLNATCEVWLYNIKNAKYIVTDSFHGMCFAIIFRKPFCVILNKLRGKTRFTNILELLNLTDRVIETEEDLLNNEKIFEEIDYEKVYKILEKEVARSQNWLIYNIEKYKNKVAPLSTYDIVDQRCDFLHRLTDQYKDDLTEIFEKKFSSLNEKIKELEEKIIILENQNKSNI